MNNLLECMSCITCIPGVQGGCKRGWDPINLELWTIVNCHVGIKPKSSAKAANTLDSVSLVPP